MADRFVGTGKHCGSSNLFGFAGWVADGQHVRRPQHSRDAMDRPANSFAKPDSTMFTESMARAQRFG